MTINRSLGIWTVRLLLAALFLFGSEIILWTDPINHSMLDWFVRGIGYVLLATLTLDIAQRYRIRDGFDAMVVLAGSALFYNLLMNPTIGWTMIPDSVLTRIIGSDALVQLIMWGIFLAWLQGDVRKYHWQQAVGGIWLGIYWGFWMRWTPELRGTFDALPFSQLAIIAGVSFALIALFYLLVTAQTAKMIQADQFMLSPLEWAFAGMGLIALFLVQAALGTISAASFLITLAILAVCWLILWLRREDDETSILEKHTPLKMQNPIWIITLIASFAGAFYMAYHLPLITEVGFINQLWLMEIGSAGIGIIWLPIVASVIATRTIDRFMREGWAF